MQTLDCNPDLNPLVKPAKPLPPLETLVVSPSASLQILFTTIYLVFLGALMGLVWPRLGEVGWLFFLLLIGLLLALSWWQQLRSVRVTKRVWFNQKGWFVENHGIAEPVMLSGEALVWPWVIVLRFKPYKMTASHQYLVVMRDSVSPRDFRQLSRWLRICLKIQR